MSTRRLHVIAAVVLLAACASRAPAVTPSHITPAVQTWRIQKPDGAAASLGDFAGQPIVVNFWATWCAPCVQELASFQRLMHRVEDTDIVFVFVTAEDPQRVRTFARRHRLDLPFYTEVQDAPADLAVRALPTTIVIGRDGRLVLHHRGALAWDDPEIVARLRELAGAEGGGAVQAHAARTKHLEAKLSREGDAVRLTIQPRNGWRIIAADDSLTGRPLRITWNGAEPIAQLQPGTHYVVAGDTARVYERRTEWRTRALSYPVTARVEYVACRDVCEPGSVQLRLVGR